MGIYIMTLAAVIERRRRDREDWKYTDLEALLKTPRPRPAAIEPQGQTPNARLVFKNGVFRPQASHFGAVPSCILMGDLESGYSLTLGEQTCLVAQPVELVFITGKKAPREIALKLSIDIGDNGRLSLLENYLASDVPVIVETDIVLHPHAKLMHGKIAGGGAHLATHKVHILTGGYYNNVSLLLGGAPCRNEFDVMLLGEEAQASLNGIALLRGREHADTTTRITHQAPNCTSRQMYKTVLDGRSRGVFQGKISVAQGAQKSDGYQLSRALLLSDKAEMDAKPELEIFADDVKCSHGSAIGDLDEDAMFYLRSRGMDEKQARALLIEGFLAETLDEVHIDEWREIFRRNIEGWEK